MATLSETSAGKSGLTLETLRGRREEILRIAEQYEASNIRVFGSVARGEADERSDLDLLVDFKTEKRGLARFGLMHDLARDIGVLLDVRVDMATAVQSHACERVAQDIVPL